MKTLIYYNKDGKIVRHTSLQKEEEVEEINGLSYLVVKEINEDLSLCYIDNKKVIPIPIEAPNEFCEWEGVKKGWVDIRDVTEVRSYYLSLLNEKVEKARQAYTTVAAGQDQVYEMKYTEAVNGGGPILEAEATALDKPLDTLISEVLAARQRLETNTSRIEVARLKAKQGIKGTSCSLEMSRIVAGFSFSGNA